MDHNGGGPDDGTDGFSLVMWWVRLRDGLEGCCLLSPTGTLFGENLILKSIKGEAAFPTIITSPGHNTRFTTMRSHLLDLAQFKNITPSTFHTVTRSHFSTIVGRLLRRDKGYDLLEYLRILE